MQMSTDVSTRKAIAKCVMELDSDGDVRFVGPGLWPLENRIMCETEKQLAIQVAALQTQLDELRQACFVEVMPNIHGDTEKWRARSVISKHVGKFVISEAQKYGFGQFGRSIRIESDE